MYNYSISFVVPAYNEQDNIKKVIGNAYEFLCNNFTNFEIIIVDDGSTDNTQSICQNLMSIYKDRLIVLRHTKNRGYGAALRTGLFSSKRDLVFYTDADNQFDISEIKDFMEHIDYDMVIGYRKNRKDVVTRKFASFGFKCLIFIIFGLNFKDIDCSFKLFKKNSLKSLSIDTDGFLVDTELLLKAKRNNFRIKQLPVTHLQRLLGKSCIKFKHIFTTLIEVGQLFVRIYIKKGICSNVL